MSSFGKTKSFKQRYYEEVEEYCNYVMNCNRLDYESAQYAEGIIKDSEYNCYDDVAFFDDYDEEENFVY